MVRHFGEKKFGLLTNYVTIAPTGEVVIVDNDSIIVLDNKLNLLKVIGQGSGNSRLVIPYGVAVRDNIIDGGTHQVKKYSLQLRYLQSVIGCHGDKKGQFKYPKGLAFNVNKLLYVVARWG